MEGNELISHQIRNIVDSRQIHPEKPSILRKLAPIAGGIALLGHLVSCTGCQTTNSDAYRTGYDKPGLQNEINKRFENKDLFWPVYRSKN